MIPRIFHCAISKMPHEILMSQKFSSCILSFMCWSYLESKNGDECRDEPRISSWGGPEINEKKKNSNTHPYSHWRNQEIFFVYFEFYVLVILKK